MVRNRWRPLVAVAFLLSAGYLWAEGLDANYGAKLPSVYDEGDKLPKIKGKEFKVLGVGVLEGGQSKTIKNVLYEKNALCLALGYGRGLDTNLDIFVTESNGGNEIGKDILGDNFPLVVWKSGENCTVDIRVYNAGTKTCSYVLLANY